MIRKEKICFNYNNSLTILSFSTITTIIFLKVWFYFLFDSVEVEFDMCDNLVELEVGQVRGRCMCMWRMQHHLAQIKSNLMAQQRVVEDMIYLNQSHLNHHRQQMAQQDLMVQEVHFQVHIYKRKKEKVNDMKKLRIILVTL